MANKISRAKLFLKNEEGATVVEYTLIAAFMGFMLILSMPLLSNAVSGKFSVLTSGIIAIK